MSPSTFDRQSTARRHKGLSSYLRISLGPSGLGARDHVFEAGWQTRSHYLKGRTGVTTARLKKGRSFCNTVCRKENARNTHQLLAVFRRFSQAASRRFGSSIFIRSMWQVNRKTGSLFQFGNDRNLAPMQQCQVFHNGQSQSGSAHIA
jgi:hypothetical protein